LFFAASAHAEKVVIAAAADLKFAMEEIVAAFKRAHTANEVQVTRFGVGNFLGLIEAGKVKALAVSADKRSPLLPNVPTFAEAGLGGYPGHGWWGLAPRGTAARY
jgi:tripartite-type tricarboxylate transporter receptor subunit TctC